MRQNTFRTCRYNHRHRRSCPRSPAHRCRGTHCFRCQGTRPAQCRPRTSLRRFHRRHSWSLPGRRPRHSTRRWSRGWSIRRCEYRSDRPGNSCHRTNRSHPHGRSGKAHRRHRPAEPDRAHTDRSRRHRSGRRRRGDHRRMSHSPRPAGSCSARSRRCRHRSSPVSQGGTWVSCSDSSAAVPCRACGPSCAVCGGPAPRRRPCQRCRPVHPLQEA